MYFPLKIKLDVQASISKTVWGSPQCWWGKDEDPQQFFLPYEKSDKSERDYDQK